MQLMQVSSTQHNPFEVELPLAVQAGDLDEMGLICDRTYWRWLEDLRAQLLNSWLSSDRAHLAYRSTLASTRIEYKQPFKPAKPVLGKMWIAELSPTQWTLKAEIHCGSKLVAIATQTGFQLDCNTMQAVPIPEDLFSHYWEYQWNL